MTDFDFYFTLGQQAGSTCFPLQKPTLLSCPSSHRAVPFLRFRANLSLYSFRPCLLRKIKTLQQLPRLVGCTSSRAWVAAPPPGPGWLPLLPRLGGCTSSQAWMATSPGSSHSHAKFLPSLSMVIILFLASLPQNGLKQQQSLFHISKSRAWPKVGAPSRSALHFQLQKRYFPKWHYYFKHQIKDPEATYFLFPFAVPFAGSSLGVGADPPGAGW